MVRTNSLAKTSIKRGRNETSINGSKTLELAFVENLTDDVKSESKDVKLNYDHQVDIFLSNIEKLNDDFQDIYDTAFKQNSMLNRQLVSFQANKQKPVYRWYKYKEAFSADLVDLMIDKYHINGRILDPFAGSGTALFAASERGLNAVGIELLPIGQQIIKTRTVLESKFKSSDYSRLKIWASDQPWKQAKKGLALNTLRITDGAYPPETKDSMEKYLSSITKEKKIIEQVLYFALLCVLESTSYTRKDGQYLRWDYRSGRKQGKRVFDKGSISGFDQAVSDKINEIVNDGENGKLAQLFAEEKKASKGSIELLSGSCLDILPSMLESEYDAVITSPPYCNRYDYTRTYALELALLNIREEEMSKLRQQMLSCTVENREKDLLAINADWKRAIKATDNQKLLQLIVKYLEWMKEKGELNNNGIPRMVKGYFYELACVISECARVLKPNAPLIMVNDNVRYAGASISVDMILSDIASNLGLEVENILVLPNGKGNSSQQMGEHGRESLRKCVYIWRKKA